MLRRVNRVCCLILAALMCVHLVAAFEPLGPEARRQAIGRIDSLPEALRHALDPGDAFLPISPPEPGDWLDAHPEKGQTFDQDSAGFDVVKRYEDLARFYRAEGWTAETEWVRRRLATIAGR